MFINLILRIDYLIKTTNKMSQIAPNRCILDMVFRSATSGSFSCPADILFLLNELLIRDKVEEHCYQNFRWRWPMIMEEGVVRYVTTLKECLLLPLPYAYTEMIKKGEIGPIRLITGHGSHWKMAVTQPPPEKKWTLPLELAQDIKLLRRGESFFKATVQAGHLGLAGSENEVSDTEGFSLFNTSLICKQKLATSDDVFERTGLAYRHLRLRWILPEMGTRGPDDSRRFVDKMYSTRELQAGYSTAYAQEKGYAYGSHMKRPKNPLSQRGIKYEIATVDHMVPGYLGFGIRVIVKGCSKKEGDAVITKYRKDDTFSVKYDDGRTCDILTKEQVESYPRFQVGKVGPGGCFEMRGEGASANTRTRHLLAGEGLHFRNQVYGLRESDMAWNPSPKDLEILSSLEDQVNMSDVQILNHMRKNNHIRPVQYEKYIRDVERGALDDGYVHSGGAPCMDEHGPRRISGIIPTISWIPMVTTMS
jgi:hypothetical protein